MDYDSMPAACRRCSVEGPNDSPPRDKTPSCGPSETTQQTIQDHHADARETARDVKPYAARTPLRYRFFF